MKWKKLFLMLCCVGWALPVLTQSQTGGFDTAQIPERVIASTIQAVVAAPADSFDTKELYNEGYPRDVQFRVSFASGQVHYEVKYNWYGSRLEVRKTALYDGADLGNEGAQEQIETTTTHHLFFGDDMDQKYKQGPDGYVDAGVEFIRDKPGRILAPVSGVLVTDRGVHDREHFSFYQDEYWDALLILRKKAGM